MSGRLVMAKPDLKRSLMFLARDRAAQWKHPAYIHQSPAMLEKSRRKDADKRFNGIVAARKQINEVQV